MKNYKKTLVMISKLPFISSISLIIFLAFTPFFSYAALQNPLPDYIPLGLIPGTTKGPCTSANITPPANSPAGWRPASANCETTLGTYLPGIYKSAIAIAGVLAVLVITYAGIEYMLSEAVTSKESAKKKIWNALGGLVLAFVSYLILYTLNPDLLNLRAGIANAPAIPQTVLRGQLYNVRSPATYDCIRPDKNLIERNTTVGFVCSQNPNSGAIVRTNQVCCHWADR